MSLRFVLIGHPVAHSVSPAIHQAAYDSLGLSHRYELVDAPDEDTAREVVEQLRRGAIAGANVTIPWKRLALRLADEADPSAARIGAANVLRRSADGRIVAHNTDVTALRDELAELAPRPSALLVVGSGGAALAAVASCKLLGAEVAVLARRFDIRAERSSVAAEFVALGAEPLCWPADEAARAELVRFAARSDVIVQATSAGMHGADDGTTLAGLFPWAELPARTAAYDLVYNPAETPFLRAARMSGHAARGGLGMLVGQARGAIELWLGVSAPREPLLSAAQAELDARRS